MKHISRFLLLLFLVCLFARLHSQNDTIDSLNLELATVKVDSIKVDILNELARENFRIEPEKTLDYATASMRLASQISYTKGIGESHRMFGYYLESQGHYDTALFHYNKSYIIFQQISHLKGQADALNDLGVLYYSTSDYINALKYLSESKGINGQLGNDYGVARAMLNIAHIYTDQGEKQKGLDNLNQAYEIFKGLNNTRAQAICLVNIGIVYKEQGRLEEALENYAEGLAVAWNLGNKYMMAKIYNNLGVIQEEKAEFARAVDNYHKALALYEELGSPEGQTETYSNIGIVYRQLGELDKAVEYFLLAIETNRMLKSKFDESLNYIDLASLYYDQKEYDKSLDYYQQSYHITDSLQSECGSETALTGMGIVHMSLGRIDSAKFFLNKGHRKSIDCNSPFVQTTSSFNLYKLFSKEGDFNKALDYLNSSYDLAKRHGYQIELKNASLELYKHFKSAGNTSLALAYHEDFQSAKDSIFNTSTTKKIANLTSTFEFEEEKRRLENEIAIVSAESEITTLRLERNTLQLIGVVIGSILLILSIIALTSRRNYKLKARMSEEKERQQKLRFKAVIDAEEKERKRIAQELHDGLGQLLSTARLNVSVLDEGSESNQTQVNNSLKLIDSAVSEVRTISHNMMPNALISIGFEAALREQAHLINDANKVKLHLSLPDEKIEMDESKAVGLYRIIQEIVNNALKYADAQNIWINLRQETELLSFEIKDDGKGFDTKLIESSSGIGWTNIISRADILDGALKIESQIGQGSVVSLKMAV